MILNIVKSIIAAAIIMSLCVAAFNGLIYFASHFPVVYDIAFLAVMFAIITCLWYAIRYAK